MKLKNIGLGVALLALLVGGMLGLAVPFRLPASTRNTARQPESHRPTSEYFRRWIIGGLPPRTARRLLELTPSEYRRHDATGRYARSGG